LKDRLYTIFAIKGKITDYLEFDNKVSAVKKAKSLEKRGWDVDIFVTNLIFKLELNKVEWK
jgi:hypothetical protein